MNTMWTITDIAGDSGTVTVEAYDIAETLTPWYPEAPAEVTQAVADLETAVLRGDYAGDLAVFLGVDIAQAHS